MRDRLIIVVKVGLRNTSKVCWPGLLKLSATLVPKGVSEQKFLAQSTPWKIRQLIAMRHCSQTILLPVQLSTKIAPYLFG